jgi:restriction system protein
MSDELIHIGEPLAHWNVAVTRILKYSIEISHTGLNEHKLVSAPALDILDNKVNLQLTRWSEKWEKVTAKMKKEAEREANLEEAETKTREAQRALEQVGSLLQHTLSIDDAVDWETLKNKKDFEKPKPPKPRRGKHKEIPNKPERSASQFAPEFTLLDKFSQSRRKKKILECDTKYEDAVKDWEKEVSETLLYNDGVDQERSIAIRDWESKVSDWEVERANFYKRTAEYNDKVDKMKEMYHSRDKAAVTEYCEMVLNNSQYPENFPQNFEIEYIPDNASLIVEFALPTENCLPTVKEVKYVASKRELRETHISAAETKRTYDSVLYQITLRSIHELFEADVTDALSVVSFNGWVNSVDKATGKEENKCILSIQATRSEFMQIELAKVDPKMCFNKLKGVASSKLSSLTPVQPILQISKTDKRFVEARSVVDGLANVTNLAAMDWEDFEHLIREVFEKEFSVNGGEVKVTQASRDGGVDAIAFDPDPIRGGKIVIQAKRYTNTVGVSAVRDLYGTVLNEGATKGILVTTADYGPDAYEFAKGKPLTLLSGSNLLHLLGKHGHQAKIDLKEAKKILSEGDQA